jgi:serine/threonine-protein kinase
MTSLSGLLSACGLAGAVLLTSAVAWAADPADLAAAEALFAEGRELMEAGDFASACPKLAESQRLDPGTGTALNLADCYEKQGRTATAWGTWLEAATLARQSAQPERERFARERAQSLEARLHRLVISVPPESRVEGLQITRSGVEVRAGAWGTALPVDPGEYAIEASAPGRVTHRDTIRIDEGPGQSEVRIPVLAEVPTEGPAPGAPPPAPVAPSDGGSSSGSSRRTVGIVLTSVGAGTLAVSGFFGLRAMSLNSDSKDHCRTDVLCDARGLSLREDALAAGNLATILAGVGGALAVTGVVLWVTAPNSDAPRVGAVSSGDGAQLLLRGDF